MGEGWGEGIEPTVVVKVLVRIAIVVTVAPIIIWRWRWAVGCPKRKGSLFRASFL
jgi:hypothetical protein